MEFRTFDVDGLLEIIPHKIEDDRGYFAETYRAEPFFERAGNIKFVQENQSLSVKAGTIRGLHFQTAPFAQGKLVRCLAGSVFDVAVDLRAASPTYGKASSTVLTAAAANQFWVPAGFAHGFCTLEQNSIIAYRVTAYYSRDHDSGVAWDDPAFAIDWPAIADDDTLSPKDRQLSAFADLPAYF